MKRGDLGGSRTEDSMEASKRHKQRRVEQSGYEGSPGIEVMGVGTLPGAFCPRLQRAATLEELHPVQAETLSEDAKKSEVCFSERGVSRRL